MHLPERAIKFLRLALCEGAHEGEATAAALMFIKELKKEGITAEQFERKPPAKGFERATRYEPGNAPTSPPYTPPRHTASQPIQTPSATTHRTGKVIYGHGTMLVKGFPAFQGKILAELTNPEIFWLYEQPHLKPSLHREVNQEMADRGLV